LQENEAPKIPAVEDIGRTFRDNSQEKSAEHIPEPVDCNTDDNIEQVHSSAPVKNIEAVPVSTDEMKSNKVETNDFEGIQMCGEVREWPPQPGEQGPDSNLTTVYPSVFKMRNEAPVQQARPPVFASQPALSNKRPMRMRGDRKWPPAGCGDETQNSNDGQLIKPRVQRRDYSKFFAKNQLPSNYTAYRVPPGTQHVGFEDEEEEYDETDM